MTHPVNPPFGAGLDPVGTDQARPSNDHLRALHTRIVDAKAGFDVMVDKAEPGFRDVAVSFRDMHERHAGAVADMLHGDVDADGSIMGTVNKAMVSLRAWFDDIDEDIMDQVRQGEAHVLDAFRTAEQHSSQGDEARLIALRAELEDLLDRTAHLD